MQTLARTLLHRLRDPAQRQHARLPGAQGHRRRRAAGGVLRGASTLRAPAPAGGVLRGRRRPLDPRPPRGAGLGDEPQQRSPLWSRAAYDRYLEWAFEAGTTPNGVFGAKLMWGYFGDFVSLLRNIPAYSGPPLAELLPAVFPDLTFVRVVRANKVRQAVSLWKAVQTATWRQEDAATGSGVSEAGQAPYESFLEDHRPQLRFHYGAIEHLLGQILSRRRTGTRSSSTPGSSPCWCSTRTSPPTTRFRPATCSTA